MPIPILMDPEIRFGAMTFMAISHKSDSCGSNGLPLTPNSIIIYGKAQILKTIQHPHLCQYLDIIRGRHERTIIVAQYSGKPLVNFIEKEEFHYEDIKRFAYQMLSALNELHTMGISHRHLGPDNILLQENGNIRLFNYGLFYMTDNGKLVSFPIIQVLYAAPEVFFDKLGVTSAHSKVDVWSIGIILTELILQKKVWNSLNLGQKLRKVLSLVQSNGSVFERIVREHNKYDSIQDIPKDLIDLIESCLKVYPKDRLDCATLLQSSIFDDFRNVKTTNKSKVCEPFVPFTINELYYWWQLAGGDVVLELRKQDLIRNTPPILNLPCLVTLNGDVMSHTKNPAIMYDPRVVLMPLDELHRRLSHIPLNSYYPLLHSRSRIIEAAEEPPYDTTGLSLVIRERDPEYQFHRVILFKRILYGCPFTKQYLVLEAEKDIPPIVRPDVWASLLDVHPNYTETYLRIDKETATATDRQIEVDIPRCHQYNELLSSTEGHKKLKRLLKAWVNNNTQYVYWQGLDSLTAPFLFLHFNDEAKAFACLSAFIRKYLHNFFLKDNSAVIHEYLGKFSQLIGFQDPILANHLMDINFNPELFAIPWFLTVFSHVFPLDKVLHLWDKLLLGDSSFPLHIGLAVLAQLRHRLLNSGFNDCILLFSDLPEIDMEKCVENSVATFEGTPKSVTLRRYQNLDMLSPRTDLDIDISTAEELDRSKCPRISAADVLSIIRKNTQKCLLIDIRNSVEFNRCTVRSSISIPFSSISYSKISLEAFGQHASTIENNNGNLVIVIGDEGSDLDLIPNFLVKCGISKVCVLHGGFNILRTISPTILHCPNLINLVY